MRARVGVALSFLSLMAVISPYVLAESDSPRGSDCAVLQQWIKANPDKLPKTLPELSTYPQGYRRLVFAALPPTWKSEIWNVQLRLYLNENPNITPRKKSLIERARSLADPALFMRSPSLTKTERMKKVEELERLVLEVFPQDEARSLFYSIGSPDQFRLSLTAQKLIPGALAVCNCRGSLDCEGSALCQSTRCTRTETGCGFMGTQPCTGECKILVLPPGK